LPSFSLQSIFLPSVFLHELLSSNLAFASLLSPDTNLVLLTIFSFQCAARRNYSSSESASPQPVKIYNNADLYLNSLSE